MMRNWAQAPIKISIGLLASILKSSVDSVNPMVSMMSPKMTVCVVPETHLKVSGTKNVNRAMPIIKIDV